MLRRAAAALPIEALGLAAVLLARGFPPVPGQAYGPGLFPKVLGAGLMIRAAVPVLRLPRKPLMAPLLLFACLGAYAVENSLLGIGVMLGCRARGACAQMLDRRARCSSVVHNKPGCGASRLPSRLPGRRPSCPGHANNEEGRMTPP